MTDQTQVQVMKGCRLLHPLDKNQVPQAFFQEDKVNCTIALNLVRYA